MLYLNFPTTSLFCFGHGMQLTCILSYYWSNDFGCWRKGIANYCKFSVRRVVLCQLNVKIGQQHITAKVVKQTQRCAKPGITRHRFLKLKWHQNESNICQKIT
jgi:hypothetical protein